MNKFNRKEAIAILNSDKYIREFENAIEPINTGWVIYWKGKPVKPKGGNNHYFASQEAAIQGIDRNILLGRDIERELAKNLLGLNIPKEIHISECEDFRNHFRMDLILRQNFNDKGEKLPSRTYISLSELSVEDQKIREEKQKELRAFESFCHNALKTVFVKKWMEEGLLEIKKV
jgi:hypothetical protein